VIHDAQVEMTCDGKDCNASEWFRIPAGTRNSYIAEDSAIERDAAGAGWIVRDGKHYCCEDCAKPV